MPGIAAPFEAGTIERLAFAADVREGLARRQGKQIPSRYLYDAIGSALFEAITWLPEYGLTAADERLLRRHAVDLAEAATTPSIQGALHVVELGSGTGRKTRHLLEEMGRRRRVLYHAVDVSTLSLARCRLELSGVKGVRVSALPLPYLDGLRRVTSTRRGGSPLVVLFLGSTIGNFQRDEAVGFLREVRALLRGDDLLLLGADLQRDPAALIAAYDDAAGVTAAFDRNVLARINRELEGAFDPRLFEHEARWNAPERRVEMHLVSRQAQTVPVPGAGIVARFFAGESIWTESSCKFDPEEVGRLARRAGFSCDAQWIDPQWPFAETLLRAV
jgi:L-histidine N-alpha-methyltransferase